MKDGRWKVKDHLGKASSLRFRAWTVFSKPQRGLAGLEPSRSTISMVVGEDGWTRGSW